MFEDSDHFPSLKGKAAEMRWLAKPMSLVWQDFMDPALQLHRQIKMLLDQAALIEELLDAHPAELVLPPGVGQQFAKACFRYNQLLTAVGSWHHERGLVVFNYTIKNHYLCHIGLLANYLNPRIFWNYQGEDFVGRLRKVIAACQQGRPGHRVSAKAVKRYCLGLGYLLQPC